MIIIIIIIIVIVLRDIRADKDPDQPAHMGSLIGFFVGQIMSVYGPVGFSSGQHLECVDVQAEQGLGCAHKTLYVFCCALALYCYFYFLLVNHYYVYWNYDYFHYYYYYYIHVVKILNDRRRTSVPYFSSNDRTVLIYTIFQLFFALISLENDALKFLFLWFQVLASQNIV